MRQHILLLPVLALLMSACQTLDPNADPVVVNAERGVQASFVAVDKFLKFEREHELVISVSAPKLHEAAESLRRLAPDAFREAWRLIDVYKKNRTPENKATMGTAIKLVDEMLILADRYLIEAKGAK